MRRLYLALLLLLAVAPAQAGENTVPRYIEFRDGSLLRLPVLDQDWQVAVIRTTGRIETTTIRPSQLQSLQLTAEDNFTQKRAFLTAVQQLGANSFRAREEAFSTLRKLGPEARADLETCLNLTTDVETKLRLHELLRKLPEGPATPRSNPGFDRLHFKETLWGHLGEQGVTVVLDGKRYRLGRKNVAAMLSELPAGHMLPGPMGTDGGLKRLGPNDFPLGCVEEGFETTPTGRALQIGENIEKLFISRGFVLSTSITTSHVSVNNYVVQGKSRGLSAATHQPLWNGEITIKFVQPGNENVPATVTHFGCYIAAVMPRGTALHAYDLRGRELGVIHTQQHNTDFLGVRSTIPMHRIRIVPDPNIDRDYTLDDFTFTPPLSPEASHPEKFTVKLTGGDLILCQDVSLAGTRITLHGLPAGLPERTLPREEVARINPPRPRPQDLQKLPTGTFAELRDGSILHAPEPAEPRARPVFPRRPELVKTVTQLAGLWSAIHPRLAGTPRGNYPVLYDAQERTWREITQVKLLEEVVLWKTPAGQPESSSYRKLPPLWLAAPASPPPTGTWRVRTIQGEDLIVTSGQPFTGRMSREFTVIWQGQPLRLTAAEVVSLFQVRD